ncbi:MAG TPA: SGNH/GDSL hydrolase family protein [Allosphingosinicella sp.]|jgi:lysophospholipase L1-like esterase
MRIAAAALAFVLLGAAPAGLPLAVTPGGRVLVIGDGQARFGWPGVYFEGRFRGTAVRVGVVSDTDFFRVLIDGRERMVLKRPQAPVTISGLSPGEHLLRIEKMTESQTGGGRLLAVETMEGGTPLPPPRWKPQVEFIGDSYTVGYGNTSPTRKCTRAEVHDTTDTQQAFGPVVAKRLGYDYRVIAYSGFGIVRNYNGNRAGETMPLLYPRMLPDDPVHLETARGRWRLKAIVINLGTNDFSTPLHGGEAWGNANALHAAYRAGYTAFARRLMAAQPQARLVLMGGPTFAADVEAVAKTLASPKVRTVRFDGLELGSCDFHPSLKDHARLAQLLEPLLR